jgi:hypothetical protein
MRRHWEAFWVFFSTGYDSKRVDRRRLYTDESGSSSGWFVLRPAGLRGGGQAKCPQIPGTDLKVLGFNIGAQVARDSTVPAGRVFSLQATRLISSTRCDRRWARRQQHCGVQDAHNLASKLWQRCSIAKLVPRSTRYTYHTMNGTRSDCSHYICSSRPVPGSALAWVKPLR